MIRAAAGRFACVSLVVAALVWCAPARAAQLATVDVDDAGLYEGPATSYKVIEKLPKGTQLAASNLPTQGFFKVRTPSGSVGWLSSETLVFANPSQTDKNPDRGPHRKFVRLRLLGGYDFFHASDTDRFFQGVRVMAGGIHAGAELGFLVSKYTALVLRAEKYFFQSSANDQATTPATSTDLSINSYPVMGGVDIQLSHGKSAAFGLSFLAGVAMSTEMKATNLSTAGSTPTVWSDQPFTGMGKLSLLVFPQKTFGFYAEGGYRYLKTSSLLPTTVGTNSPAMFEDSSKAFIPFTLDLSGFFAGAGITLSF